MEAKGKKKFVGKSGKAPRGKVPHGKRKFKKDSGPPKKLLNKGDEEGKPKSVSKKFVKGQLRPGRASVKQFKNKQQSEKLAKKRKLQDGEEGGSDSKKPKWNDFKKKRKELKQTRQLNDKNNYDIIVKSKQIWESVRRKKCDKEKREKLMNELQKLLHGKIKSVRKTNAIMHKFTKASLKNGEM